MSNRWALAGLLAASMTIATAGAWGQGISAEVPFPFHANGADLPPGHYTISQLTTSGFPVIRIANFDAKKSTLAIGRAAYYKGNPTPRMTFRCTNGDCVLTEIWGLERGIDLPRPRVKNAEKAQITTVPINKTKAD